MKTLFCCQLLLLGNASAETPILLPKSARGYTLELDRKPLEAGSKLKDVRHEDEGILQIRLLAPDPAKNSRPLVLPLRFAPASEGGVMACEWSDSGRMVAFIMACYEPGKDAEHRLFIFTAHAGGFKMLSPPSLTSLKAFKDRGIAKISELGHLDTGYSVFGWIGDDILIAPIYGGCLLTDDLPAGEWRELHGVVVYDISAKGRVAVRKIMNLRVQG